MFIPGVGRLDKKVVYCLVITFLTVLFLFIIYPNLPTPAASFYQSNDYTYVTPNNLPTTFLVCSKNNERCSTINDETKNYDLPMLKDLDKFLDLLKTKVFPAESTPSFFLVDIAKRQFGFFSFSVSDSLASQYSSPLPKSPSKILAVANVKDDAHGMEKTIELTRKNGDSNNKQAFSDIEIVRDLISSSPNLQANSAADIKVVRLDVGDETKTLAALQSVQDSLLLSQSKSNNNKNGNPPSNAQIVFVRLSTSHHQNPPDVAKSSALLHYMHSFGYVAYLPENRTTLTEKDFSGSLFEGSVATSTTTTIYFVRGDVSLTLLCSELDVPFLLFSIGSMIFLGCVYVYILNSRAHAAMNMSNALMTGEESMSSMFQRGGMMSAGLGQLQNHQNISANTHHGFPMMVLSK